jgi:hypothetical protein
MLLEYALKADGGDAIREPTTLTVPAHEPARAAR